MTEASSTSGTVVGVLGAGRMGTPIIGHLVAAGYRTLVYDPDPARAGEIEARGAAPVASLGEVGERCSVVLVCVGFEHQLVGALSGDGGLLSLLPPDSLVAVLSTVSPERVIALAEEGAQWEIHVVDATVCRGSWAADKGELLSFVGGPDAVVERLRPVIATYSSDVVRAGDVGAAQVAKAVNNLILWACLVADHEGLALASRYGLEIEPLRAALLASSAANHALENWGNQTMAWAEDDLRIVAEMAVNVGISLPQAGLDRELCRTLRPRRYDLDRYGR